MAQDKYTILLVEDDISILKLMEYIFKKEYNVLLAENGSLAIEIINENKPDIIISDIMMPEMDGLELKEKLNMDEELKDIPFIFLTAISDAATREKVLELGVKEFIVKPVKPNEIKDLVYNTLH